MAIVINGQTGIDAGHLPISNAGNTEVEGTLTAQGQNVSPFSGFKNYIINGNFDVWQRGTTFINLDSLSYTADRWTFNKGTSVQSIQRVISAGDISEVEGQPKYHVSVSRSTAATTPTNFLMQRIEGVHTLAGRTCTFSFWARSNTTDKVVSVMALQVFGIDGSPATIKSESVTILSGSWNKYSVTFELDSVIGKTLGTDENNYLQIAFQETTGFSAFSIVFANVQLEEGSVATPFENRPYGLELSLCQYFLRPIYVAVQNQVTTTAGQNTTQNLYFPSMRTTPTVINKSAVYAGAINASSVASVTKNSIQYEFYYGALNALGSGQRTDLLSAEL